MPMKIASAITITRSKGFVSDSSGEPLKRWLRFLLGRRTLGAYTSVGDGHCFGRRALELDAHLDQIRIIT